MNIVDDLNKRNAGFRVLAGAQIDTTTANGRLIFGIFAALAEFKAELIRERTKAGLAAASARGRIGGRPRKLNIAAFITWGGRKGFRRSSIAGQRGGRIPASGYFGIVVQ